MGMTEMNRVNQVDSMGEMGRMLSKIEARGSFEDSLRDTSTLIAEPGMNDSIRKKAREDIQYSIGMGISSGLISPVEGANLQRLHLEAADEQLAINRAVLGIETNPSRVMSDLGISTTMGGSDAAQAAINASGGVVQLDASLARMVAEFTGDKAFPEDEKLAKAYITDPDVNKRLTNAAMDMLTKRYNGDLTAAIIAASPDGGTVLADKWVKSKHDESVLPPKVREYYRKVMQGVAPKRDQTPLPLVTDLEVVIEGVDVEFLD